MAIDDWEEDNTSEWVEDSKPVQPAKPEQEKSLMSRIAERYGKVPFGLGGIAKMRTPVVAAGQTVGALNDIAGSAISALIPDAVKRNVSQWPIFEQAREIMPTAPGMGLLRSGIDAYADWKQRNPNDATLIESMGNIGSIVPLGKGAQVAGHVASALGRTEAANVVKDAAYLTKEAIRTIPKSDFDTIVPALVSKKLHKAGIRPTGIKDISQANTFYKDAGQAVYSIVKRNTDEPISRSPNPLMSFANANKRTMQEIADEFTTMSKAAGDDLIPMESEAAALKTYLNKNRNALEIDNPGYIKELEDLIKRTENSKGMTASEMEASIANINNDLAGVKKNPIIGISDVQKTKALQAEVRRKILDKAITESQGEGYSALKKEYGANRAIQQAVARKAVSEAGKGINISYLDILSASGTFHGLLTTNPELVLGALLTEGALSGARYLKNPNRLIKGMFKDVEDLVEKKNRTFQPKSDYFFNRMDKSGTMPTPLSLPSSERYEELLDALRGRGNNLLDIPRRDEVLQLPPGGQVVPYDPPRLDIPRRDETLLLPPGQTFEIPPAPLPVPVSARGQGFVSRPASGPEGLSKGQITREMLRELIKENKKKKGNKRYLQPGY